MANELPTPRKNETPDDFEYHSANIKQIGFTIVSDVLNEQEINQLKELLDPIYENFDPERDSRQRVEGCRFAANLVDKDPLFETLILRKQIYGLIRHHLGDDCILSSLNTMDPCKGHGRQNLHRDGGYPLSERIMSMNSFWAVDAMNIENGATRVVPGSHKNEIPPESMEHRTIQLEIPAGHVTVTNSRVVHAASTNHSGERRRIFHMFYVRNGESQQTEQKKYLSPDVQARVSPLARKVLALD